MPSALSSVKIVADLQTSKYFNVAGLAIWVLDYILSFESEVRLVWGRKWDLTRVLFTISRYVTIIGVLMTVYSAVAIRTGNCSTFALVSNIFHILSIVAAEALLILRTYAFWQRSRRLLVWILALSAVALVGAVGVPHAAPDKPSFYTNPGGCLFIPGVHAPVIQYSFLAAFEFVLLLLTTYRMYKHYRDAKSIVVTALYQGSMLYMTCMMLITLANIVVSRAFPLGSRNALDTLQLVVHGILAARILFNLRECDAQVHNDMLPSSGNQPSLIHFASKKETTTTDTNFAMESLH